MEYEIQEVLALLKSAMSAYKHGRKATCREKLGQAIDILLSVESKVLNGGVSYQCEFDDGHCPYGPY